MSPSEKEKEQEKEKEGEQSHSEKIVCPVCKRVVHDIDLPNKESVIDENLYFESGILIVDSDVTLYRRFEHMHDEQKGALVQPHDIVGVLKTHFNETGECTVFEIVELLNVQEVEKWKT
ncbi:MAG: hypothetical protein PVF58_22990 [Candidatus Methanofastidiosia archaeon]|jgi:hypothetical protein